MKTKRYFVGEFDGHGITLLQQMWIEKWNGGLPSTMLGQGQNLMFGLNK